MQTLRRSGTKSTLKKTRKLQEQNLARQRLVQQETRHLLLVEKELEQQVRMLEHRLEELSPRPEPEPLDQQDLTYHLKPDLLKLDRLDNPALPLMAWLEQQERSTPSSSSPSSQ
jgi:hypothetical protein